MITTKTREELAAEAVREPFSVLVRARNDLLATKDAREQAGSLEELLQELNRLIRLTESEMRHVEESMFQGVWGLSPWQERKRLLSERTDLCSLHMTLLNDFIQVLSTLVHSDYWSTSLVT